MIEMFRMIRPAFMILLAMTLLTGVAYPLVVTGAAQLLFPSQANGSLIERNGRMVGSMLIGQSFDDPRYFWGRLSAISPPCDGGSSTGSNLGPLNPALKEAVGRRIAALRAADAQLPATIPADLVTASGSGLDPDISPAAASIQIPRVARLRRLPEKAVRDLVDQHSKARQLGFLGEPRVTVLELNLAVDDLERQARHLADQRSKPRRSKY